ncbi:MAG: hypothetical protein H0U73_04440 [Tatlockia sp.]|nr:hypothetical protein [Tatlockia sp.]
MKFFLRSLILLSVLSESANALPIYPAEIVGRELSMSGFGWAGHIGITTANDISQVSDQIIEVMNDFPVIQINPLTHFKLKNVYWGARFGISDRGDQGSQIIKEANLQRGFCPIYTSTAAFVAGTGYDDLGKPTHCAVFRCDTFVNYVFHTAGYELPTYNSFTFPVLVYNLFPKGHGDGSKVWESLLLTENQATYSSATSITKVDAKRLDQMSSEEFIALVDLPAQNLTKETISSAWQLARDPVLNAEKRIYIVDYLGLAGTVDLIPQFIDEYYKNDNEELKSMLLRSTFTLHQKYSWLKDYPSEKDSLQKFYTDLLNKKLSARDSELVQRGYINLSSKEDILSNLDMLSANQGHNPQASVGLMIELLMKSQELEKRSIPEILSLLHHENSSDLDDLFNQFIVRRLGKLGTDALLPESKNLIRTHLDAISFRYNHNSRGFGFNLNAPYYGAWLEATALVNSNSLKDAASFVANFIQSKSMKERANFMSGLSNSDYMKKAFQTEPAFLKFKKQD